MGGASGIDPAEQIKLWCYRPTKIQMQCGFMLYLRSSSVHQRQWFGPKGDVSNLRVRMSNLIAQNLATFLRLLTNEGRLFFVVLEQPKSSWFWQLEWIMALGALLACIRINTWLFGEYVV